MPNSSAAPRPARPRLEPRRSVCRRTAAGPPGVGAETCAGRRAGSGPDLRARRCLGAGTLSERRAPLAAQKAACNWHPDGRSASSSDFLCSGVLMSAPLIIYRQLRLQAKQFSIHDKPKTRNKPLVLPRDETSGGSLLLHPIHEFVKKQHFIGIGFWLPPTFKAWNFVGGRKQTLPAS